MSDRELLEKAAKAAGLHFHGHRETKTIAAAWVSTTGSTDDWFCWNPLADDGDALRLAVKLNIGVMSAQYTGRTCAWLYCEGRDGEFFEPHGADICAATRRAIVRAAAALADR